MQNIFNKKEYKIFFRPNYGTNIKFNKKNKDNDSKGEYIVYNTKKEWAEGHTHIDKYERALYLIDCCIKKKIPKKTNDYFLISLTRLTRDEKYKKQIQHILDGEEPKKNYRNVPKHFLNKYK